MKSRKKMAATFGALAIACSPVVASATNLFTENFDSGTAGTRFDQFSLDRAAGTHPPYDTRAIYNFDYGSYKYWHVSADAQTQDVGEFIPQAPRSLGVAKTGLLLDANNVADPATPNTAQIDIYPKLAEYAGAALPTGDHVLTFDVWMNYNGRITGGGGSTEFMTAGVNQTGGGIGGLVLTGSPGLAGQSIAVTGDGQNGLDYRMYQGNTRYQELDPAAGYVAVDQGPSLPGPSGADNPYYQAAFPFTNPANANEAWYEDVGAIGKHWTTVQIKVEDGIVYTYMKPAGAADYTLIAARTDTSATSGHIMLGYADTFNGIADLETGDGSLGPGGFGDANFSIYDNVTVDTLTQVRQKWNVDASGTWSDTTKWLNSDDANGIIEVADFTTALSTAKTVTVDGAKTVRSITFDSAVGYTLAGANTITINSLTTGIQGKIKAVTGSHLISAPVILARPTLFDVAAGAQIKLASLDAGGQAVTKVGTGVAEVNKLVTPTLTISAGTMKLTADSSLNGVSVINTLAIATNAKLDIGANKVITKNVIGTITGTTYSDVAGLIQSGRNGGGWGGATGIVTSQTQATTSNITTIGVATAAQVKGIATTATSTWGGQTVTGTDTLVMYTYGGDANLDGKINVDDYTRIDFNVPLGSTGWYNGDFNYDGKINVDDYTIIDFNVGIQGAQFPTAGGVNGLTAVPEPASLGAIALAAGGLAMRRQRRPSR
jgi:hypothetical protein